MLKKLTTLLLCTTLGVCSLHADVGSESDSVRTLHPTPESLLYEKHKRYIVPDDVYVTYKASMLRRAFDLWDKNGNGEITPQEFNDGVDHWWEDLAELKAFISWDENGDKEIHWHELRDRVDLTGFQIWFADETTPVVILNNLREEMAFAWTEEPVDLYDNDLRDVFSAL